MWKWCLWYTYINLAHFIFHKFNLNISKLGFKPNNISPKVIKLTKNLPCSQPPCWNLLIYFSISQGIYFGVHAFHIYLHIISKLSKLLPTEKGHVLNNNFSNNNCRIINIWNLLNCHSLLFVHTNHFGHLKHRNVVIFSSPCQEDRLISAIHVDNYKNQYAY